MRTGLDAIERLRSANPVDAASLAAELQGAPLDRARSRAVLIAQEEPAIETVAAPPGPRARTQVAIALGALALLAAASLTPPVQAVAERLGELVGIGDEPTRNAEGLIDEPAIVIGTGESPNGTAYEVVASADMNIYRDVDPPTCIGLDFPQVEGPSNAGCLTPQLAGSLDRKVVVPVAFLGPPELGEDRLIVDGLASPEVSSAEVERIMDDGSIDRYPVRVHHLTADLAREIGASREAAFFLALLPEGLVPPVPQPSRPAEPEDAVSLPAPAPGSVFEAPPPIGRDPFSPSPEGEEASPAKRALARLSLVAYNADGQEIARESLDDGPYSDVTLYANLANPGGERATEILEDCFREVLPSYGTPGEIPPELPMSFGDDLGACAAERGASERPAK